MSAKGFEKLKLLMEKDGGVEEAKRVVKFCSRLLREELEFFRDEMRQQLLVYTNIENEFHAGVYSASEFEKKMDEKIKKLISMEV